MKGIEGEEMAGERKREVGMNKRKCLFPQD